MTILSFRVLQGIEVKARVKIYRSSKVISGKEYETVNAYIPLPSFVRYLGLEGSRVNVIVFKENNNDIYESVVRKMTATRYGVFVPKSTIDKLNLKNDDEVYAIIIRGLTEEVKKETEEGEI
ncbi:MAG: hypothetical protein ACP5GY_06000 [Vulcanisaeta sp.]